ncbi:MAG: glycosyltransferase family 2 protein [Candidatus Aquicultor sp.]
MLLSIVLVNYNSADMLVDCLRSIHESKLDFEHEIIVVDNDSHDDSLKKAKSGFPAVRYLENKDNIGFARANNQGIRLAKGQYVLIQNPDTLVIGHAIENLVGFIRNNPGIGIVGGKLLNRDGSLQYSIRRFPAITGQLFEALFMHKIAPQLSRRLGEVVLGESAYGKPLGVDWITGAIMMVDRAAIEQVGMLDESFFLYAEEVDWCYRMRQNGWRIVYYPDAVFTHFMGKTKANLQLYTQHLRARRQFSYKHFSRFKALMFDIASLIYLINRSTLFLALSIVKPSDDVSQMGRLYYQSGKELIKMVASGAELPKHRP